MELLVSLLIKIAPLYIFILVGYLLRKTFPIDNQTIARVLIYFLVPVVVFNATFTSPNAGSLLTLTFYFYLVAIFLGILSFYLTVHFFKDTTRNLLALTAGTANMGYFGLPVIIALLSESAMNIAIFCVLGTTLYETTLGYFLAARGNFTWQQSIKKLLGLPSVYAFIAGFLFASFGLKPGGSYNEMFSLIKGGYVILGMMLVGIGIGSVKRFTIDLSFITASFFIKFILWPICIAGIILLDEKFFHLFSEVEKKAMIILSVTPLAANAVAYATELDIQPGKAAFAVFISTVFALFWIPLMVSLFF